MVTVFLRGGLGNQMFQYAAGRGLAKKMNTDVALDTTYLSDRSPRGKDFTYRTYDLDVFAFEPHFTKLSRIASAVPIPGLWLGCDFAAMKLGKALGTRKIIVEDSTVMGSSDLSQASHAAVLYGYFQSEKYFENVKDDIYRDFQFQKRLDGKGAKMGEAISKENSVAVHVRRGDYLFQKNIDLFAQITPTYYEQALRYIGERVPNPHVFVFSDDLDWCEKNLRIPFDKTYVTHDMAGPKFSYYLELMSLCNHFVIANSSFSWWGAWLNRNPQKIVIAPKQWHANPAKDTDVVPSSWVRL